MSRHPDVHRARLGAHYVKRPVNHFGLRRSERSGERDVFRAIGDLARRCWREHAAHVEKRRVVVERGLSVDFAALRKPLLTHELHEGRCTTGVVAVFFNAVDAHVANAVHDASGNISRNHRARELAQRNCALRLGLEILGRHVAEMRQEAARIGQSLRRKVFVVIGKLRGPARASIISQHIREG